MPSECRDDKPSVGAAVDATLSVEVEDEVRRQPILVSRFGGVPEYVPLLGCSRVLEFSPLAFAGFGMGGVPVNCVFDFAGPEGRVSVVLPALVASRAPGFS